ncbi:winged helix-turn-helix domain-containing protein [Raineyella fluvialis]|uniref:Winged helix-turn-helix domain-containing protein n=1 Tax=Raineyella fluvialis TaxID=2662261 RepID=A0A5Q2F8C3_9ACTN|nr:crosslink repair DNA glycosylase YcaQ family protein [Raineyella fluvialis]QGF22908.1 winged helix-turn-helix domain-containing protein [Raineyella fluvialis]
MTGGLRRPPAGIVSLPAARRIALAAQGFGAARPLAGPVTMRHLQRILDRVAQFQIDSVNVVQRAHYLPLFSRLGPYDTGLLDRAGGAAPRRLFEYWGHAASLVDVRLEPSLRFRMARAEDEAWGGMQRVRHEHPELVAAVLAEVGRGPGTARQLEVRLADEVPVPGGRPPRWGWNWSEVKAATEWLLWSGQISVARRTPQFERVFDLPARVLPGDVASALTPTDPEAVVTLVRRAAAALGIGSLGCLTDYFRLDRAETAAAVAALEQSGELIPVEVPGWTRQAWLWHEARRPRRIEASAVVSPFDSLVFERRRLRGLFDFDYGLEIYVPGPRRRYGYYVYPFLLGERLVARVDIKADRQTGELVVRSAWLEEGTDPAVVSPALLGELELMAAWLGLGAVRTVPPAEWRLPGNGRPLPLLRM